MRTGGGVAKADRLPHRSVDVDLRPSLRHLLDACLSFRTFLFPIGLLCSPFQVNAFRDPKPRQLVERRNLPNVELRTVGWANSTAGGNGMDRSCRFRLGLKTSGARIQASVQDLLYEYQFRPMLKKLETLGLLGP